MSTGTQMEFPSLEIPEQPRTLSVSFDGIRFEITDPPPAWRAPFDDCLVCLVCDDYLDVIAPNLLHSVPLAMCACSSCFLEPLDDRDRGLLELAHPVSEEDARLGEKFHRELSRLAATKEPKKETAASRSTKTADSVNQNESTNSRTTK